MSGGHTVELVICTALFALVAVMGFMATRWRAAADKNSLHEWGLGGGKFGTWVSWFLIGGDLYSAYTFVAVPALMFGAGATGFFAIPYATLLWPLGFFVLTRLWSVCRRNGFVTAADFVQSRYDSKFLALLMAVTGIVATMPYVALQLAGVKAVLATMGVTGSWPLIIAFLVLALYTYNSGLRAPALIAFVKDALIYIVILVAVIYIPIRIGGGWTAIFHQSATHFKQTGGPILAQHTQTSYWTLALGSGVALMLYPHCTTGILAAKNRNVVKRNMALLPLYSLLLVGLALLGFMAIAAHVAPVGTDGNTIVPALMDHMFSNWFAGVAFAAIAIGALVPAAVMSIAAANTFTRNIYTAYVRPDASPKEETTVAKIVSLLVKFGAVGFIVWLNPTFAIDLQLIGGVIIIQTLPTVVFGLFTRWFHRGALMLGWAAGMTVALIMLYQLPQRSATGAIVKHHFGGSSYPLTKLGIHSPDSVYVGILTLIVNLVVAIVFTVVFRLAKVPAGVDGTKRNDYWSEDGAPDTAPAAVPQAAAPAVGSAQADPAPA